MEADQPLFRDIIYNASPYDRLSPDNFPDDQQGWGSDHPILSRAVTKLRPQRILEIGSWKGRSAINMARQIDRLALSCELVCVDTWLGSPEHWLKAEIGYYESLQLLNGYPRLYYTFAANVIRAGCQSIITPFPSTSESAFHVFEHLKFKFDMIYLDAAHEYEPVLRDLRGCWKVLSDGGVLIGDDYINWGTVTRAADDFGLEINQPLRNESEKYWFTKGNSDFVDGSPEMILGL